MNSAPRKADKGTSAWRLLICLAFGHRWGRWEYYAERGFPYGNVTSTGRRCRRCSQFMDYRGFMVSEEAAKEAK